ncbi:uncharacterized protein LOC124260456 [Haliotis rubra]|uniref:uncharacterized protein LOC124260456 n=1 Tax=Haliotis rubra TaxID=36100 RepID=UPI001EE60E10|nr:uncharacterized protein LOC124260456 [Haliotis rubra]
MGCSGSSITATVATTNTNTDGGYNGQTALTCSTNGQRQDRTQEHCQTNGVLYPNVAHSPQCYGAHQNQILQPMVNGVPSELTTVEDDKEKEQEKFLKLPSYSRRQISHHNSEQGWVEWGVFGKRICDCSKIRYNTSFLNMILQRKMEHYPSLYLDFGDEDTWKKNAPLLMDIVGFSKAEIHAALSPYVMGRVEEIQLSEFWSDIREDVAGLEQELSRAEDISPYQQELLEQVQRWLAAYRHVDPEEPCHRQGDPNGLPFPLPEDIAQKPEVLRMWIIEWEQFDTADAELPLAELTELSDKTDDKETHGTFALTLRPYDITEDLNFDDPQWETLPSDVIANDVTKPCQDEINQQRDKRVDLHDTTRMGSRRRKLAQYFIVKYEWQAEKLSSYLQWADVMKEGELRFAALCEQS